MKNAPLIPGRFLFYQIERLCTTGFTLPYLGSIGTLRSRFFLALLCICLRFCFTGNGFLSSPAGSLLRSGFCSCFCFNSSAIEQAEINQFYQCHISIITRPCANFDHTGISPGTGCNFLCYFPEKFIDGLLAAQHAENDTAVMRRVTLGPGEQWFHITTQSLCFGRCSGNVLMYNQGCCHICLLYTSDAADERSSVDLGGRRI